MNRLALAVAAIGAATAGRCQAPFDMDPGFVVDIYQRYVSSTLVLPNGKVLASGEMRLPGETADRRLILFNTDGTVDGAFPTNPFGSGKLTPWDSMFYVATPHTVRRMQYSGFPDPSFISMNQGPYFLSIQGGDYYVYPDGRVILSGAHELRDSIRGYQGIYSLIWFTNTGYLDTTQHHRTCNGSIDKIHPLPDGRFLLSGVFSTYEGQPVGRIIRVEANGALDTTFHTDIVWGRAADFEVLADQRMLAAGYFQYAGSSDTLQVIRLLPDGAPDPTYSPLNSCTLAGRGRFVPISNMFRLSPDTIIINGGFDHIDGVAQAGLAAIDSNGVRRTDFLNFPGCGSWTDTFLGVTYNTTEGMVPDGTGGYYIYGSYRGFDDGTTNSTAQRFITRLYGLNVGVREMEKPLALQVFPNPADEQVTVRFDMGDNGEQAVLVVLDLAGREVLRQPFIRADMVLDTRQLANGTYTAMLLAGGEQLAVQPLTITR